MVFWKRSRPRRVPSPRRRQGSPARPYHLSMEELESRQMLDAGTHWFSAGLATFGQVVPRGTTYTGLRVGNLPTQNDVKSWWDDGSLKFVILTATIPTAGYYTLNPGNPATGNFAVTVPDVTVQFNIEANT